MEGEPGGSPGPGRLPHTRRRSPCRNGGGAGRLPGRDRHGGIRRRFLRRNGGGAGRLPGPEAAWAERGRPKRAAMEGEPGGSPGPPPSTSRNPQTTPPQWRGSREAPRASICPSGDSTCPRAAMEGEPGGSRAQLAQRSAGGRRPAAMEGEPGGSPGDRARVHQGPLQEAAMEGEPGGSPGAIPTWRSGIRC